MDCGVWDGLWESVDDKEKKGLRSVRGYKIRFDRFGATIRPLQGLRIVLLCFFFLSLPGRSSAQFNTDRLMLSGRMALQYDDYVLSIQYFNRVISVKPYLYEPWMLRAVAKYYLDDYVGAEFDATKAIELNPYIDNLYDLRGISRIRQANYKDAIADYTKAISLNPSLQGYWYNRAVCELNDSCYDEALAQTDTIIARWAGMANAYTLKAEIWLNKKDTTEAAKWLDKSLELDPYDANAWTTRAYMAMNRRQWKDGDRFLTEAIRLKPSTVANYINRALCRVQTNNLRGVMADYDKAIELDPDNFLAHYNRGLLRVQLGDDNRAVEDFDFVVRMEPRNFMAIYNRALLLDRIGDLHGAVRDYTTVINQFPNFWTGLEQRAACYRRLGMTAKAELDEFRVFKAQMDKHIGVQHRWSRAQLRSVRKRSEINLDKYNQLVVEDEKPAPEHDYKSAYRGHVQNRQVGLSVLAMYQLSFTPYDNGVRTYQVFEREVEDFNSRMQPRRKLYLSCTPSTLGESQVNDCFSLIDSLSARIDAMASVQALNKVARSRLLALLLQRAVAYSVVQDYSSAVADLDTYVSMDTTSAMAYAERAVCQTVLNSFASSAQADRQLALQRAEDDFSHAIRLNPQNAYLYYDRANFHALQDNYGRAIDDYTKALEIDNNLAEAWYNRGVSRINAGNRADGVKDLSRAGELGLYDAYSIIKQQGK